LPCSIEPTPGEVDIPLEDPIKPFNTAEYKVLSKKIEEVKVPSTAPASGDHTPSSSQASSKNTSMATKVISQLDADLSSERNATSKVKNEITEKTEKIKRSTKRITELDEMIKKADELIENKEQAQRALEKRLKTLNSDIRSLSAAQDAENKLYREYETLKASTLEKQTELSLLKTNITELQKFSDEKTAQGEEIDDELAKVKKKVDTVKRSATIDKSELQQELSQLRGEVDELQMQVNNTSDNSLEKVLTQTQEALETLKRKSKAEIDIMDKYQNTINRHGEIDRQYTQLKIQYDEEIAELTKKLNAENDEVRARLRESE
jgi:chromosome segregation ATPase